MNDFKITSKFYNFSVLLWDYLIGNFMFLFYNIHLLLFFILFKTESLLFLMMALFVLSLNIIPSFIGLNYLYINKKEPDESVSKLFIKGYKKSFKSSFKSNLIFTAVLYLLILDYQYFSQVGNSFLTLLFALGILILAYFVFSYCLIQANFNFNLKESILLSIMYFKELNRSVVSALGLLMISAYMIKANVYIIIFIIFAVLSKTIVNFSNDARRIIYLNHTDEGIKEKKELKNDRNN